MTERYGLHRPDQMKQQSIYLSLLAEDIYKDIYPCTFMETLTKSREICGVYTHRHTTFAKHLSTKALEIKT